MAAQGVVFSQLWSADVFRRLAFAGASPELKNPVMAVNFEVGDATALRYMQGTSLAEHLLVLVHGINAGPKDGDDVIEVLQDDLGSTVFIHASSANPTFQTFVGIDLVGKLLADELPLAFGIPVLEEFAANFTVGRTARQLFLIDGEPNESPLLLRMATDCTEGPFISALTAFKSRMTYANVNFDQMVGWRTASIRRESKLITPPQKSLGGYKHIVSETICPAVERMRPKFQPESAQKKALAQFAPGSTTRVSYPRTVEEEMIRGLQQMSWRKIDMSFHLATIPFLAHNHFHVKYVWPVQFVGAGLIAHIIDSVKFQELQQPLDSSF